MPKSENKHNCVWHCCGCNNHFSSIAAFDAHRPDMACIEPAVVTGLKGVHKGKKLLSPWTNEGYCNLMSDSKYDGKVVHEYFPVTVWQTADLYGKH